MEKIEVSQQTMNLILMAVEHGVRQCEKGNNLQASLSSVFGLYTVKKPKTEFVSVGAFCKIRDDSLTLPREERIKLIETLSRSLTP